MLLETVWRRPSLKGASVEYCLRPSFAAVGRRPASSTLDSQLQADGVSVCATMTNSRHSIISPIIAGGAIQANVAFPPTFAVQLTHGQQRPLWDHSLAYFGGRLAEKGRPPHACT